MTLAVLKSRALAGMQAPEVTVEVHLANGLPSFTIVGLPETEVKESKDRVRAALQNARFEFPSRRITRFFRTIVLVKRPISPLFIED
ncbi:subunit ChlI of Mg-chelatase family protein [Collimonas arenae]|uniref:Subunit ChlI of Mg-chelatase family protein n=1 Tax=Collimonas arenae TaxID=279058 RepID=A0A127QQ77_9BURK|nr:subunit ChlI of Mg-chelatase family protein [Collimonas arenae]AMP11945.1 subunit ChlI of Mg-chelatase family protein [Collimonas arenae]